MSIQIQYTNNVVKNYLADQQPFTKHFEPVPIMMAAGRTVAIQGLLIFNKYVEQLVEAEEDDDEDINVDLPSLQQFNTLCIINFIKTVSITTTRRTLELVAIQKLDVRIAGKLIKDTSKSALRKAIRYSSKSQAATLMIKTGIRSSILPNIAIFIIEEIHQLILLIRRRSKREKSFMKDSELMNLDNEDFLWITLKNLARCGGAIVCGAIGVSVGTFLQPGKGTKVGAFLGDSLAYMI